MNSFNRSTYILALSLSALAGSVDAIGFIQLGGYFISFMSGNSTRLAVNFVQGNGGGLALVAKIILLFVAGVTLANMVRHFAKASQGLAVLAFVTGLLAAAACCHEAGQDFMAIALMTMAMGAENVVFQRNGEVVVGLTYMTGTLVKIGQRVAGALIGGDKWAWLPYLGLWLSLISGGIIGGMLFYALGLRSLWIAALWSAAMTAAAALLKDRLVI